MFKHHLADDPGLTLRAAMFSLLFGRHSIEMLDCAFN